MPKVSILVSTFKRPVGLATLLESLGRLTFPKNPDTDVRVVVVDNDATGSARDLVQKIKGTFPWPLVYDVEQGRGGPFSRNAAVALAGEADFVAFIDDDEIADPLWLDELVDAQKKYQADIVSGPQIPVYESNVAEWVVKYKFHDLDRYETGYSPEWSSTGNSLVNREMLQRLDGPFDTSMALCGGSDHLMFVQLKMLGARNVWADEAIVTETIPESRTTAKWTMLRGFRKGTTYAIVKRKTGLTNIQASRIAARRVAVIGWVTLLLALSLFRGKGHVVKTMSRIFWNVGCLAGLVGYRYDEYRTIHGG